MTNVNTTAWKILPVKQKTGYLNLRVQIIVGVTKNRQKNRTKITNTNTNKVVKPVFDN